MQFLLKMKFIQSRVQQFVKKHNAFYGILMVIIIVLSLFMIRSTTHAIDMMIHPYNEVYKT